MDLKKAQVFSLDYRYNIFDNNYANLEEIIPTFEGEYEAQYEDEEEEEKLEAIESNEE